MLEAAESAGVTNATGFNYRYVPAVALAKELLAAGRLGELRHYRAVYLQDYQTAGGQPRSSGGAGAVLDYSPRRHARFLVGEPESVAGMTSKLVSDVDDAFVAVFELAGGLVAALESRVATGWKGHHRFELNGSDGSIWWDMEDPNRLHVFFTEDERGARRLPRRSRHQPEHPFLAGGGRRGTCSAGARLRARWRDFLEAVLDE